MTDHALLNDKELRVMKHALGFPEPGAKGTRGWRNRYYTYSDTEQGKIWEYLVGQGLAASQPADASGRYRFYSVTKRGCEILGLTRDEIIDATGTEDEQRELSERRANAIARKLNEQEKPKSKRKKQPRYV